MTSADIADGLGALAGRGIAVSVAPSGLLQVRPASYLTRAERVWLRGHAGAILAHLGATPGGRDARPSGSAPWDLGAALRLTHGADSLVGQLGVDGRHPRVQDAAAAVVGALATRDMETLRFAVAEFVAVVRELPRKQTSPAEREERP